MIVTIENDYLSVAIQKKGAELCSFRSKKSDTEFMWNGDPTVWGSFAPVLFPIIGCLKDNEFFHRGKRGTVPKHGFIRNNEELNVTQINESTVEFSFKYSEKTLENYPFMFEFKVRYQLVGPSLEVHHSIQNHSAKDPLYYSVGGHPAFRCPFYENETYEDYYLEFEQEETVDTWEVTKDGLIDTTTKSLLARQRSLPLYPTIFQNDALILKTLKSRSVQLRSKNHATYLQVEFDDFNYLGLWAKPNAPFICIEPWLGISDSVRATKEISEKEGMLSLAPLSEGWHTYCIKIQEKNYSLKIE
jgi:galactose mutarotase-like enzyme